MKPRYQGPTAQPADAAHDGRGSHQPGRTEADDRGRSADKPSDLSKRGWKDILWRTKEQMKKDNLSIVAAGVAFYIFFGIIPALGALISIYGLVADPATIKQQIDALGGVLPSQVLSILDEQMTRIASKSTGATWGAALGILLALWSGAKATKSVMMALNIVYEDEETRSFLRLTAVALGLTLAGVIGGIVAISLIVALPVFLKAISNGGAAETIVNLLRWPLLAVFAMFGLAALYRFAPDRKPARWRWVSWGAGLATLAWVAVSAGFSFYVTHFGSYNKTYGSLGAVVVLMLWLLITAYVVLVGAELNSEMEHQTARDTTSPPGEPRGRRGAYLADDVGPSKPGKNN